MLASIDRIDRSQGYVEGNARFILSCLNGFKHDGTDEQMYAIAEALINNRKVTSAPHKNLLQFPVAHTTHTE